MSDLITVLNPSDRAFYDNAFRVTIGYYTSIDTVVYADCEGDALDTVIDDMESKEKENPGHFLTAAQADHLPLSVLEDTIQGGNHSRYLSFDNEELKIVPLDGDNTLYMEV